MRKEHIILGKDVSPETRRRFNDIVGHYHKEKIKGEIEKSPEDLKWIEAANNFIREEIKSLGIKSQVSEILPEQIHLIRESPSLLKIFIGKIFPHKEKTAKIEGSADSMGRILLKGSPALFDEPEIRIEKYHAVLHEMGHDYSYRKHIYEDAKFGGYRSGYLIQRYHLDKFTGLSEAVNAKLTLELIKNNANKIIEDFFPESQEMPFINSISARYARYMNLLDKIMEKIADDKKENRDDVWVRFKKGHFTGEMMHLRDIEKSFGKKSLRVLAELGVGHYIHGSEMQENVDKKVFKYFALDDQKEKAKIAEEILV